MVRPDIRPVGPQLRTPRDHILSRSFLFVGTLIYDLDRAIPMSVMLLYLSVVLFLVGLVIFFFTIHKMVATVVCRSRTLWSCLFDADRPCLCRPILTLPYSTIPCVVVTSGGTRLHISVTQYTVHVLATISHYPVSLTPLPSDTTGLLLSPRFVYTFSVFTLFRHCI